MDIETFLSTLKTAICNGSYTPVLIHGTHLRFVPPSYRDGICPISVVCLYVETRDWFKPSHLWRKALSLSTRRRRDAARHVRQYMDAYARSLGEHVLGMSDTNCQHVIIAADGSEETPRPPAWLRERFLEIAGVVPA